MKPLRGQIWISFLHVFARFSVTKGIEILGQLYCKWNFYKCNNTIVTVVLESENNGHTCK